MLLEAQSSRVLCMHLCRELFSLLVNFCRRLALRMERATWGNLFSKLVNTCMISSAAFLCAFEKLTSSENSAWLHLTNQETCCVNKRVLNEMFSFLLCYVSRAFIKRSARRLDFSLFRYKTGQVVASCHSVVSKVVFWVYRFFPPEGELHWLIASRRILIRRSWLCWLSVGADLLWQLPTYQTISAWGERITSTVSWLRGLFNLHSSPLSSWAHFCLLVMSNTAANKREEGWAECACREPNEQHKKRRTKKESERFWARWRRRLRHRRRQSQFAPASFKCCCPQ